MERLTKWLNDKKNLCIKECEKECVEKYTECHKCEPFKDVMKRLAEYEDAEEQGLLLRLPCKVGDTVWCIFEGKVYEAITQKVTIVTGLNNYQFVKIEAEFDMVDPFYDDGRLRKYGVYQNYLKTVFLTKEEAEQELVNRQQSQAETIMNERNGR